MPATCGQTMWWHGRINGEVEAIVTRLGCVGLRGEQGKCSGISNWAWVEEWRSALGHGRGAALTERWWKGAKLALGQAVIMAMRGQAARRREGEGVDERN